ncbi:uncharacterized protein LOC133733707 [Rosa rugosa]|uniref:uncharacterized protein LOC133733707 n=1 Tax=Rosa rugosa TaxID=74645 RepID=UPI002B40ABEF|nr:uncharacterized protein LOC133733707 [Rosa rugosa]
MDFEKDTATLPLACTAHGCPAKAQVRQKKKKTSAVKFFLCFQRDDVVFPCVVPMPVPVVSSSMVTSDSDLDVGKCNNQQRKPERHGFFHVLKAILFKMLLVKKIQQKKSGSSFANIPTKESSITSGHTQEWSDHEDVPKMITKTTSGGKTVFTYVKEKEEVVFPTMPASSWLKNEETCQDQWINKGRRRLSRILKAVLFETSLARKIQARKLGKKYESNTSLRSSTGESCEEDNHDLGKSASSLTNSSVFTSSLLNSTSSSSTVSRSTSHSRSLSERIKSFRSISSSNLKANLRNLSDKIRSNSNHLKSNSRNKMSLESINSSGLKEEQHAHFNDDVTDIGKNNKKGGCYRSASGLSFLLMSLVGLIFYGKLCAILCTSMWLVCVPLWSFGYHNSSTNKVVDNKKVTMGGGMLGGTARTRTRIFQSQ